MNKYYIYIGIALAIGIIALFVSRAELATKKPKRDRSKGAASAIELGVADYHLGQRIEKNRKNINTNIGAIKVNYDALYGENGVADSFADVRADLADLRSDVEALASWREVIDARIKGIYTTQDRLREELQARARLPISSRLSGVIQQQPAGPYTGPIPNQQPAGPYTGPIPNQQLPARK